MPKFRQVAAIGLFIKPQEGKGGASFLGYFIVSFAVARYF